MKINIPKNTWGFIVNWPKPVKLLVPKKPNYSFEELVGVLTAVNQLQQAVLEMVQRSVLENEKDKK